MIALLVLDDSTITRMLRTPEIVAAFPFMTNLSTRVTPPAQASRCKPCARKRVQNTFDYNTLKTAIANLPMAQKLKLKKLLDAQKLRLYYFNGRRQKVKMTF